MQSKMKKRAILVTLCVLFVTVVLAMNGFEPAQVCLRVFAVLSMCAIGAAVAFYAMTSGKTMQTKKASMREMRKAA